MSEAKKPRSTRKPKPAAQAEASSGPVFEWCANEATHAAIGRVEADFNGADPAAFDHDGDGKPGGSKPKAALTEHELTGLFAEAYEAYDLMDERIRFDSLNRRWDFAPDRDGDHTVLKLQVKRLEDVREDTISTALLASDLGRDLCEDVVRKLDRALG